MDTWAPVAGALVAQGARVIRYDHRGHGSSTLPDGDGALTVNRLGADLRAVLEHFDARDAVLAGHSMGGMASQAFVLDHSDVAAERIRHLFLVATAAGGLSRHPLARAAPRTISSGAVERLLRTRYGHVFVRGVLGKSPHPAAVVATRDAFVNTTPTSRAQHLLAMFDMEFRHDSPSIGIPTTVVIGTRDTLTPAVHGRELAAAIPEASLVEVRGAGHMLPYEASDLVADLIIQALP
jgi:pimeloyl-ACP methyl ester carboxylesterase